MATPDIAMTNGGPSRRIACKLCRDRKVRCGGEQPACEKCRRAGEECVYLQTQKPSKADLAQTVDALQKRLDTFVGSSLMRNHVQDEAEAYITRLKASSEGTAHTSPCSCDFNASANMNTQTAPPSTVQVSSGLGGQNLGDSIDNLSYHDQTLQPSIPVPRDESQANANHRSPEGDNELSLFSMNEYMNIDALNAAVYPQGEFDPQRQLDEDEGAAILEPVKKFSSAIFRTQAETLVMASVVADYIAWLRKAPPGGGIPNVSESPVYLGMLDNLEIRLRELCQMSETRSTGALRELVSDLGALAPPGGAMAARLGSLEENLQEEARQRAEVFRSRYNPCALLSNQGRDISE